MNPKKQLILHIGLPKTGSSFLQKEIFPYLKDVFFTGYGAETFQQTPFWDFLFGIYGGGQIKKTDNITQVEIDKSKNEIKDYLKNIEQNICLFSSENIIGSEFLTIDEKKSLCALLNKIFTSAKIVMVLRKQDEWMESMYLEGPVKYGRPIGINSFFGYKNNKFGKGKYIDIRNYNWFLILEEYIKLFGKENILALPYEMFKEKPLEFMNRFYDFTQIESYYSDFSKKVNPRISSKNRLNIFIYDALAKYQESVESIKNENIKRFIRKNDRIITNILKYIKIEFEYKFVDYSKEKLTDEQKKMIMEIHNESNKKLSEITGIDFGKYGYH